MISGLLAHKFSWKTRQRGAEYFRHGQVEILSCDQLAVDAAVYGSMTYDVWLTRRPDHVLASCDCPHADGGTPCKHLWATLLAADEARALTGSGNGSRKGSSRLELVLAEPDDEMEDDDPLESDVDFLRPRSAAPLPEASDLPLEPLSYEIHVSASATSHFLVVTFFADPPGSPGPRRLLHLRRRDVPRLVDPVDREILAGLERPDPLSSLALFADQETVPNPLGLHGDAAASLLARLCATGRCRLSTDPAGEPLAWNPETPWELWIEVRDGKRSNCVVQGSLRRGEERLTLDESKVVLSAGFLIAQGRVERIEPEGLHETGFLLKPKGEKIPAAKREQLFHWLAFSSAFPRLDLPAGMRIDAARPIPRLRLTRRQSWARAHLTFLYEDKDVSPEMPGRGVYHARQGRFLIRDLATEGLALEQLAALGFKQAPDRGNLAALALHFPSRQAPAAVQRLLAEGWAIELDGKRYRPAPAFRMAVTSGVDWLEVRGEAEVDGQKIALPELLAALKHTDGLIPLKDGSLAILPEVWRRRLASLVALGDTAGDRLRFRPVQAALLDAWLDETGTVWDETAERARRRLRDFAGIAPAEAPPGFDGRLRGYQQSGLGWLHFLRDFGFGGCLADDMGLGKTVQVLALLEARREARDREGLGPSLAVVPRSLVFNWLAEAARFAPRLRTLDFTGIGRSRNGDPFAGVDLVVTTYGTLRRDLATLRQTEFDYVILDEAQAIKNAASQTAQAARLLRGRHRLAMTGTPVENHLGELWSLLEFLNPGLLGSSPRLRTQAAELRDPDAETRDRFARALRPFLLRRTKEQIAPELPAKTEQTLFCELPAKQRRLYDELRDRYRSSLTGEIDRRGIERSKILILEALLRLRQAACHPGLVDAALASDPCAKLDLLLPQLQEIRAEGHKALVFSQFTSFLALLREELDRQDLPYLYLDGRVRDRRERVERFQSDPGCPFFLISLKAGGTGLNLTAADYVYLLDPWWNPAVEAQAIDRAHRIGQTRPVLACRIVARGTVEEKILELQKSKRDLADAILQADGSPLAGLRREDLELLLS
jgi:superfamily II DNA or RNA helicase